MEYLDVLNEKGNKTGETKSRPEVHRDGDWHQAVHLWILNSKGELLIQKRAPQKDSHPNHWDISVAGHVLSGDDSLQAIIKEANEELGLNFTREDFEPLFNYKVEIVLNDQTFFNNEFVDVYLTRKNFSVDELKLQPDEVVEAKFVDLDYLQKQIKAKNLEFVPHDEEYQKLFAYLEQNA